MCTSNTGNLQDELSPRLPEYSRSLSSYSLLVFGLVIMTYAYIYCLGSLDLTTNTHLPVLNIILPNQSPNSQAKLCLNATPYQEYATEYS